MEGRGSGGRDGGEGKWMKGKVLVSEMIKSVVGIHFMSEVSPMYMEIAYPISFAPPSLLKSFSSSSSSSSPSSLPSSSFFTSGMLLLFDGSYQEPTTPQPCKKQTTPPSIPIRDMYANQNYPKGLELPYTVRLYVAI